MDSKEVHSLLKKIKVDIEQFYSLYSRKWDRKWKVQLTKVSHFNTCHFLN